jgi:small-conductance mechanosensitive channel
MAFNPIEFLVQNDLLGAVIIFLAAFVIGRVINLFLKNIVSLFTTHTQTKLDDDLVHAIKTPFFFFIIILGLHYSLLSINFLEPYYPAITKVITIVAIIIGFFLTKSIIKALLKWYAVELSPKMNKGEDHKNLTIFRKVFEVILFIIFLLITLRYLGVEITPIIASLGIGGLAVALAMQQTLGDFIAGLSIIGDKSIKVGNYVELAETNNAGSTLQGYIDDISWRTSRIRTLGGNYVIVPNTKLAQSIVTDYTFGSDETSVGIVLHVSYKNDLDKVEKIANRIAKEVQDTVEGAVRGEVPELRYKEFQESNIMCTIYLRVASYTEKYKVQHEYMKRVKKAFEKEKIIISPPIREIHIKR